MTESEDPVWEVKSGDLDTTIEAPTAREAVEKAIRQEEPESRGQIVSVQREPVYFSTEPVLQSMGLCGEENPENP